ncbi:MAG TPA: HDOD domain-containing protein [Burkholderiales bacterium]|nr:HDOD domain-containing protein [Burkholderiales bacterium]
MNVMNTGGDALDRNADEIVKEIGIPPCPAILTKLLRETRAEEPDFRRVGQLVGGDVALASAVLKFANSPFYGLRTKAVSVQQALALLGLNTVTNLVTGLLLRQAFSGTAGPGMEAYWKASMATSLISALVCRETWRGDSGIACTYGLFRDCGMPVMLQKFPIYADIFDGSALTPGEPALEVENERYPTNHARIGAQLARSWHLPESVCFAILHHHDVPYPGDTLAQAEAGALSLIATGFAAEQLYCAAVGAACPEWARAAGWALAELELTLDEFDALGARVRASINHL